MDAGIFDSQLGKIGYNRVENRISKGEMIDPTLALTPNLVKLIAEIDEFKGRWQALESLSPEHLSALRKVATVESVGSSTRIEGAKLTDAEVETLLSNLERQSLNRAMSRR